MLRDDLVTYLENRPLPRVEPWKPRPVGREDWPPDYRGVFAWRMRKLAEFRADRNKLVGAMEYYRTHRMEFAMHWFDTYDPRKKSTDIDDGAKTQPLRWMPFVFFPRQADLWQFLDECVRDSEGGLVEKCRDMGATWEFCAWSATQFLFESDFAIGWGSRKEDLVDTPGIVDSIFEKIRMLLRRLPKMFLKYLAPGFEWKKHSTFERLINPGNGSTIEGEAGDSIGRGGRKSVYFKDESAHYERPEKVEAALGDNTDVQIDISSVNGIGNPFYNRAQAAQIWYPGVDMEAGRTRKFILDWRDHPAKTQEWYDRRKKRMMAEGLAHLFAQEVDRDYAASVTGTIIPADWIEAAIDADKKLARLGDWLAGGEVAGLDIADGGIDRNALARRKSVVLQKCIEWGERDPGVSTRNVMQELRDVPGVRCFYDSIGIGSSVKSEYNRLVDVELLPLKGTPQYAEKAKLFPEMIPWNAGAGVLNPYYRVIEGDEDTPLIRDYFANLKAQAWWSLRLRFWKTFQCVTDPTISYPIDELISLSSAIPLIRQLVAELAQPTKSATAGTLKMVVDKKPDNTKSPNLADAVVMAYFPLPTDFAVAVQSTYG